MERIWKFPLRMQEEQTIAMPSGAKLLAVQMQYSVPCLWAMVGETSTREDVTIRIQTTGQSFDATGFEYISTFQEMDGALVFHAFRVRR